MLRSEIRRIILPTMLHCWENMRERDQLTPAAKRFWHSLIIKGDVSNDTATCLRKEFYASPVAVDLYQYVLLGMPVTVKLGAREAAFVSAPEKAASINDARIVGLINEMNEGLSRVIST